MKSILSLLILLALGFQAPAQITKVALQASGLTCSMCSKAVQSTLEEVDFVKKVDVDLENQVYGLTFKEGAAVDLDALAKAVEEAGFSVAALKVTADFPQVALQKDEHIELGGHYFHFLNGDKRQLGGSTTFSIVDKQFLSAKEFRKHSTKSKMECVQTGRAAKCCVSNGVAAAARIYHAII